MVVLTILSAISLVFNVVATLMFYPSIVDTQELLEEVSFSDEMLILVDENKLDEVVDSCDKRQLTKPNDLYVYYYRGLAKYHKGEKQQALKDFKKVKELDSSWAETVSAYIDAIEGY